MKPHPPHVVVTVTHDYITGQHRALIVTAGGAVAQAHHPTVAAALSWATQWVAGREG